MKKIKRNREELIAKAIVCAHLIVGGQRLNFGNDKELERQTAVAVEALLHKGVK
jgi:hypothetical protein